MDLALSRVARAVRGALPAVIGIMAVAAHAADVKIDVTGTNIKRVDTETTSPVQIITREDIARTGQPTIADVLRALPNNNGSFGESFTNSFAPGASAISLRGLPQKATLVLLNGRRVAGYGFAQNISDTFVDLNAIPSSAVERVEILNDGASAIYGSDAIGGVVNIILRRDYAGVDGTASMGWYEGKNDYKASLSAGRGDLGADKYNVFGVLDYYKRDLVRLSETKFGETRDYRNQVGGRNFQSLTTGGTWRQLSSTGALTNTYRAISDCAATGGRVLNGTEAAALGLINLTPPTPGVPGGQTQAQFTTNQAMAAAGNTFCSRDVNSALTALPETERFGVLGRGTYQYSAHVQAYVEGMYSHTRTFQVFTAPFFSGTTALYPTSVGLQPYTYNINFAPGVAGNPFNTPARFLGSQWNIGTRNNDIDSDSYRVLAGAQWLLAGWDLDSAAGYSKNIVENRNLNRLSLSGVSAAFGVPTTPQPPVPTATSSSYNLDNPLANSAAALNSIAINFPRKSESELFLVDTKGSRELPWLKLPGGVVAVAVGGEWREERLNDQPDPRAAAGDILAQGITRTEAARRNYSVFGELSLPLVTNVEAQVAGRYDHYSDYGDSTTPKLGIRWTPLRALLLRANWGKGFRAPTLPEISKSIATSFQTVTDPEDNITRSVSSVSSGNPNLRAEKSENTTVGFVLEPFRDASLAVNAYWIDWKDRIVRPSSQQVVTTSCPNGGPGCPSIPGVVLRDPSNNNAIVAVFRQYTNQAKVTTNGIDLDARVGLPVTPFGKFTLRGTVAYIDSLKEDGVEYAGTNGGTNTIPRTKASGAVDWEYGPWSATARVNYIGGYYQQLLASSFLALQNPEFQNGTYPVRIGSHSTYDLYGSYSITKKLSVSAAVINIQDKVPPYDPGFDPTGLYDFQTYDVRGRQFRLTLSYSM